MLRNKFNILLAALALSIAFTSCKDDDDQFTPDPVITNGTVISDNGNGTGTVTWTNDNIYILDGFIFVNSGQTLTIEPGTVIKGNPGTGVNASALIVARGGKIMAEGTIDNPIIFTAEADNLDGNVDWKARGLWGGLIVLGNASLNSTPGESAIEGIPTSESRGIYGGSSDTDNSGVLQYVSIRHGGTDIGDGNEINGLTLGGVGSGTTIDHIEVISNADDGVEFFGGMPNCKNMVVAYCGDDSFDYDEGYRGMGQFWLAIQDENEGDRIGEHDGGTDPETAQPYATPMIYNATYMGRGQNNTSRIITFRDNAGGHYVNSIFLNQGKGIDIELLSGECTYDRFQSGSLEIKNNIFYDVSDGSAESLFTVSFGDGASANPDSTNASTDFANYFTSAGNSVSNPGVSYNASSWTLVPTGDVSSNMASYPNSWFENVDYKGAFEPGDNSWTNDWTLISSNGLID
ncbi:MAG: hypothetical protein ACI8XB_001278 [Patiriisocius sp.]|jgi:hypothetical protein